MPTFDYDIVSAFPTVARDLVDIRHCEWIKSSEYQPSAVYGYIKCKVTIYDWVMVSPILKETEDGRLISPTGTWETFLTKGELDFIDKWKVGEYKILEGWWAMPESDLAKPLAEPVDKLLTYKQRTGLQAALAKRMSTGIYGKFLEERLDTFGPYFNPCWGVEISTQVRLKVAEHLYQHGIGAGDNKGYKHLLHVSVDGFLLDCPIEVIDEI